MARNYATADAVGLPELLDFVRPRHHMVLTTYRADGSLQSSPVTGGVDDAGRIMIASYPQRAKSANLSRDPRASVTVLSDEFNGAYVQVDGDADGLGDVCDPCPTGPESDDADADHLDAPGTSTAPPNRRERPE